MGNLDAADDDPVSLICVLVPVFRIGLDRGASSFVAAATEPEVGAQVVPRIALQPLAELRQADRVGAERRVVDLGPRDRR